MRFKALLVLGALASTGALAEDAKKPEIGSEDKTTQDAKADLPKTVSVEVLSALIGPSKVDGSKWDGIGHVKPEVQQQVQRIAAQKVVALAGLAVGVAAAPYTAAVSLMSGIGTSFLSKEDKPDPYGTVEVAVDNEYQPAMKRDLYPRGGFEKDTFMPSFPDGAFQRIPLKKGTRFRVTLWDKDLTKSDFIGKAEITYDDLVAALNAGKIYQVMVADQTQNQLLFIGIAVRPAKENP